MREETFEILKPVRSGIALGRGLAVLTGLTAIALLVIFQALAGEKLARLGINSLLSGHGAEASAALALVLLFGTATAGRWRRSPLCRKPPTAEEMQRVVEILATQPNASAGLARLGDKKILFSDCGNAFIMYAQQGRSMVALFDPVGPRELWHMLILKFMAKARKSGCRAVFYQVSPEFLPHTSGVGLRPYKLGEQAVVDLEKFDLRGGDWVKLRRSINRAERDGLQFSMLPCDEVSAVLDELLSVSRAWLTAHNAAEKGFSLGTFQPAYVAAGPVAVIRLEGRIVAFASIHQTASAGDAFIDLMRHIPDTHRGMMDLLFVRIMDHMKKAGFSTLNIGMAPLAGLSTHAKAPIWNHLGSRIFLHGERFYNFRGVLAFKAKFEPDWHPRYLAVSGRGIPLVSMFDITMLIGGGLKGIGLKKIGLKLGLRMIGFSRMFRR